MNLIQAVIGIVFIMAFLTLAFWAMWYIAIPLMLIGLIVWLVNVIRFHFAVYRAERDANGCRIRPVEQKKQHRHTSDVIDVDYTEVP